MFWSMVMCCIGCCITNGVVHMYILLYSETKTKNQYETEYTIDPILATSSRNWSNTGEKRKRTCLEKGSIPILLTRIILDYLCAPFSLVHFPILFGVCLRENYSNIPVHFTYTHIVKASYQDMDNLMKSETK